MSESRKYSVQEIDDMRQEIRRRMSEGLEMQTVNIRDFCTEAEDRLRTYIMAGVSLDEVREAGKS